MVQVEGFGLISSKKNIFGFRPFLNDFFLKMLVFLAILGYVAYTLSKREHLKNPPVTPMDPLWPHVTPMTLFDPPWPHMTSYDLHDFILPKNLKSALWPHVTTHLTPMTPLLPHFDPNDLIWPPWRHYEHMTKFQKITKIYLYRSILNSEKIPCEIFQTFLGPGPQVAFASPRDVWNISLGMLSLSIIKKY